MSPRRPVAALALVCGLSLTGLTACDLDPAPHPAAAALVAAPGGTASASASPSVSPSVTASAPSDSDPLAGRVIVLDPGHQLGNRHFPRQIAKPVPAGGFIKPCNTTGTATDGGYPEATFAWSVARGLRARLRDLGATVRLTRHSNSDRRWGPCVDARGRAGNALPADLKISIHGDGYTVAGAHGFHVIAPTDRRPWTRDIYRPSLELARKVRTALIDAGFTVANYVAGGDGLDLRSDLATLNLSDIPTVMVELGNMRSPEDAAVMTTATGRSRYAEALSQAVVGFLG
ncbi:N-acetylmuramoyl-L-alanine amidase [Nocardioides fonticola]|uniref:N-acetylmuramoyl-L-alanine amidase n=1 Tax=Nocardioides fonticola TaxID=450363 RepID=A0ABP7XAT8_9ACTN